MLYGITTLAPGDVKASLSSKEIQKSNGQEDFAEKKKNEKERTWDALVASDDSSHDGYHSEHPDKISLTVTTSTCRRLTVLAAGSQQQRASPDFSSLQPASAIQQQQQRASLVFIMENVPESSNLPSNPSVESENVQEEVRNDKKRKQRVVSNCWDHFTKLNVGSVAKAKCNHCGTILSCGSGTSHLNRHTRQIHGFNQPTIEEVFDNKQHLVKTESGELGIQKFDPLVARQKLTTVVVKHELPLRFVEYESFRDFVDYCNPLVKHMSRNTLKSEIFKIYNVEKGKAMNLLEITNSRVAITTDMWTACNQKKGYMVVTGHFIDNSWHLQSRILRFIYVQAPHTADCISQILVKCLMDWNLDRKLSTVTLDNCSTNDAMVARLKGLLSTESMILSGNFFHMRCAAHILNLIVKDGLSVIESGITHVRDSVSYWSSSPKRVEKFELACRQIQIDVKKLGLDCPTRWNSTFAMLELAVKYKSVFSRLQTLEPQYKCLPSSEEWELAKQMLDYLRPFSKLTEMFSVKNMADNMIGKFLKYWDEINGVLVMAVILDPRYKMMLINYYYPKIYVVGLENQLKRVRELCDEMMNYYEAKSATTRYGVVDRYLEDPLVKRTPDFDVLQWWKMNKGKYPILAEMAKDLLAVPVTTVASESAFSTGGRTLSPHRSRLHPDTLKAIMCSQHWLWATSNRGGVPEEEIFTGEELKDEDEDGLQILD
ncbi:BED-type domain-containing protein [Citrus sinensis]|uniref:BED-type domain-containing protein n=1 Tax=Citrus sinensis TaxID=2711 RepID=A0ACB8NTD6_CITSI|nr:BED-type domain-containing protein [Citrus sinensis]